MKALIVVVFQRTEDAAEQKSISDEDGIWCAGYPAGFDPRTERHGGPSGLATRGEVWDVHSLGTVLGRGCGSILANHGAQGRDLRRRVSCVARSLQSRE